ncbi:hypothetical protein [Streptomyces daliensis]|uniref:Uncharacterized protein n=1 Tax=Streptomyces daliensis TaxID=299421 RepID=A0A8T4IXZ2_9ACTN|nr:hypothetical protein [Streptomyces daliensis]
MPRDHTVLIPADPDDVFYDPHGWASTAGFPVAVLEGQQAHFVMRRIQDRAVRLMYELPEGTAILTSYPRPMPQGQALELMEGNHATFLTAHACHPLRLREKGERIAVDGTARDCLATVLVPRRWWHARHARIGKALEHDGRTVILTAPLVGGRTLQLTSVAPSPTP